MGVGRTTSSSLIAKNTLPASEAKVGTSPGWYNAKVASAGAANPMYGNVELAPGTTTGMTPGMTTGTTAGLIVPVVFWTIGLQQFEGSAKRFASAPPRVYPLKVTILFVPAVALSKVAIAPGPAIKVTLAGLPLREVGTAVVPPSKFLVTSGNTSMRDTTGLFPSPVKKPEKSVGVKYVVGL